jgi:hypothetical protein
LRALGLRVRALNAIVASLLLVVLLIMQSLAQLTPRDFITVFALFFFAHFYVSRGRNKTSATG